MNIAVFSDNFYPELGGLQDSVVATAKELSRRGHTIHFFVPSFSQRDLRIGNLPQGELEIAQNVFIHRWRSVHVPSPTNQSRFVLPTISRWREIRRTKPDIIHSHTFYALGWAALTARKFLKLPLVGTNHMAISGFAAYMPIKSELFLKYFIRYAVWYYNHCDYVSAPSTSAVKELLDHGLRKPNAVVSNPINTSIFYGRTSRPKQHDALVFAGRLGPEKNIDVLIRAVAELKKTLPGITLTLAGHGSVEKRLQKLARSLGVEQAIKFAGTLTQPQLAELFRDSQLFTIASESESQSMVTLQAMACGLPVVAANSRALPDYVNNSNGRLAKPGNPQDFAKQILSLLQQPVELASLETNAVKFAQTFSPEVVADQWEKIYSQLVKI